MAHSLEDMPEILIQLVQGDLPPAEKCFSFLRQAILLGYFKKGQHLIERELVDLLKISRSPVREAIRRLESERLIAHHPNRGCTVTGLSARDIREMYDLRIVLECFLVRKVIESVDDDNLKGLRRTLEEEHQNYVPGKRAGGLINFHLYLLALVNHHWLSRFLGQLEEYIEHFHVLSYLEQERKKTALQEHMAILDALISRDTDAAVRLTRAHIEASFQVFSTAASLL